MEHSADFRNSVLMRGALFMLLTAAWVLCGGAGRAAGLADSDLKTARKLYIVKCAKCHKLHDPAGYTDSEWAAWMAKMAKKARLKKDQEELLSRYLDTLRRPGAAK